MRHRTACLAPALILALLLPAACARTPASPEAAACERQADADPAVRDLLLKSAGSEHFQIEHAQDLKDARARATLICLRRRGLAPPGGVEAPARQNSLFNGLGI